MKKRVLSALMVLCMVLTLLPVSAFAVDTKDLRDTEFHIMDISGLKQLVAEQSMVLRPVVCLRILSKKPPWAMWG